MGPINTTKWVITIVGASAVVIYGVWTIYYIARGHP